MKKIKRLILIPTITIVTIITGLSITLACMQKKEQNGRELLRALQKNDTYTAKALLSSWLIDCNRMDNDERTPLLIAAARGNTEIVNLLLSKPDIDVNKCEQVMCIGERTKGRTPLYFAAWHGHTEIVKLLLDYPGIDVNKAQYYNRKTPLNIAATNGRTEIVKLLLNFPGIDVNKADYDNKTPLNNAVTNGRTEIVKLLLDYPGIDVNKADMYYKKTPLDNAIMKGHTEIVELLKKAGAKEKK